MLPAALPHPVPLCVTLLVVVAASTDITSRRIPNRLVAIGLAGALIAQCALHGVQAAGNNIEVAGRGIAQQPVLER